MNLELRGKTSRTGEIRGRRLCALLEPQWSRKQRKLGRHQEPTRSQSWKCALRGKIHDAGACLPASDQTPKQHSRGEVTEGIFIPSAEIQGEDRALPKDVEQEGLLIANDLNTKGHSEFVCDFGFV